MKVKLKISKRIHVLPEESQMNWKFEQRPGGWILAKSSSGERRKFMLQTHNDGLNVSLRGILWSGQYLKKTRDRGGSDTYQKSDLIAQFPGKVRKILIAKGQGVMEGDPLILIEAMKMEFTIRSPYSGAIREVLVQEGQQVSPGDLFVDLEKIESEI